MTGEAILIPAWTFVAVASLSASLGAMVAALFDAVRLSAGTFLATTATPAVLAIALVEGPVPLSFAAWTTVLVLVLSGLSAMDSVTRTVPDLLTVPLILLGLVHAAANDAAAALFAGSALVVIGFGAAVARILPGRTNWIGGGDVLLLAAAVAWFGPAMLPDILLLTGLILSIHLFLGRLVDLEPATCVPVRPRAVRGLPLAPALGSAQLLVWMCGPLF
jgi:prepilin signal peptidase PulO-like enzyme (type II secretory pathway)